MTIIVGRGRSKATQRIEITDPMVSREHCWLTDNGDGTWTLQNKSQNGTFVDGKQILKTKVTPDTYIKLSGTTTVKVADLLPIPQKPVTPPPAPTPSAANKPKEVPTYSIRHLEKIWKDYHDKQLEIKNRQRSINQLRSASPIFTIGSGAIATMAKTMGWDEGIFTFTIVLTIVGLVLMVYSFVKGYNDNSIEEQEKATEDFQHRYVCPNPECRHFMGNQPYRLIRQNKTCTWCKCKYTES